MLLHARVCPFGQIGNADQAKGCSRALPRRALGVSRPSRSQLRPGGLAGRRLINRTALREWALSASLLDLHGSRPPDEGLARALKRSVSARWDRWAAA